MKPLNEQTVNMNVRTWINTQGSSKGIVTGQTLMDCGLWYIVQTSSSHWAKAHSFLDAMKDRGEGDDATWSGYWFFFTYEHQALAFKLYLDQ